MQLEEELGGSKLRYAQAHTHSSAGKRVHSHGEEAAHIALFTDAPWDVTLATRESFAARAVHTEDGHDVPSHCLPNICHLITVLCIRCGVS